MKLALVGDLIIGNRRQLTALVLLQTTAVLLTRRIAYFLKQSKEIERERERTDDFSKFKLISRLGQPKRRGEKSYTMKPP